MILSLDPTAGTPALLHPGRAHAWWATAPGPAWHDGERLWVRRDGEVVVLDLPGAAEVEGLPDGGLVAWNPAGVVLHIGPGGEPTRVHGPPDDGDAVVQVRNGADGRAVRRRGKGWLVQFDRTDFPLPKGAARSTDLRPFRRGQGVCWRSDGWLYRMRLRELPRALGSLKKSEAFATGPLGAVLVGDDDHWLRGAGPGGSLRELPEPLLRTPWGPRWHHDGGALAGVDADGTATWIDLAARQITQTASHALPLDGERACLRRGGRLEPPVDAWQPVEASCARRGSLLAGPGGVVWDLETARPCFERSVVRLGATVATEGPWATVDWESGGGAWFDPRTGDTLAAFQVPLPAGDVITRGWSRGEAAVFETAEGRQYEVAGQRCSLVEGLRPPAAAPDTGLPAVRASLQSSDGPRSLPVEAAAEVGGRVYAWSADGLLVSLPA